MQNFTSNAIKYTEKGSVTLSVTLKDSNLIISCKDTGQGISEESMEQLFVPFVRFNEKRNVNIQGTGLGLSVVKKIVDSMNGEITVSSVVDEGSIFTASVPVEVFSGVDNCAKPEKDVVQIDLSNLKILCVDDTVINVKVIQQLLSKEGIGVDAAFSGSEAITKCEETEYDVIFMDHMMPEMDGIETFHAIRNGCPLNAKTPVVILTGNSEMKDIALYKEQGLDGHLVKPVLKDQLIDKIAELLG